MNLINFIGKSINKNLRALNINLNAIIGRSKYINFHALAMNLIIAIGNLTKMA